MGKESKSQSITGSTQTVFLHMMPQEIQREIFSHLDELSLLANSGTNRKNRELSLEILKKRKLLIDLIRENKLDEALKHIKTNNLKTNFTFMHPTTKVECNLLHLLPTCIQTKNNTIHPQAKKLFDILIADEVDIHFARGALTPLNMAILNHSKDLFDWLLASGADINYNANDLTPLLLARNTTDTYFLEKLLNNDAKIFPKYLDDDGKAINPLWRLSFLKMTLNFLLQQEKLFIEKDKEEYTALLLNVSDSISKTQTILDGLGTQNMLDKAASGNTYSTIVSRVLMLLDKPADENDNQEIKKSNFNFIKKNK